MYCYKCGSEIDDRAQFCPRCGAKQQKNGSDWYSSGGSDYRKNDASGPYYREESPKSGHKENICCILGFSLAGLSLFYGGAAAALAGLVLSLVGLRQIGSERGSNRVFAIIGIVLGSLVLLWNIVMICLGVWFFGDFFGSLFNNFAYFSSGGYM